MKIVEIIHVRLTAGNPQNLSESIKKSVGPRSTEEVFTIYRRDKLKTDLAVHIHRKGGDEEKGPSQFGLRLASALKDYGLVEHTIWKEMK